MQRILRGFAAGRVLIPQSVSLNTATAVETCICRRTIGNPNSKGLPKDAAQNKSIRQRLMASFTSKRNAMPSLQTNAKNQGLQVKEAGADPVIPKLERQLTSNFDGFNKDETSDSDDEVANKRTEDGDKEKHKMDHGKGLPESKELNVSKERVEVVKKPVLRLLTGEATDIGGGHENQDKSMCFRAGKNKEHLIMAVFDGHGRDLGEIAAIVARDVMKAELQKPEVLDKLSANPTMVLEELFERAHLKIKSCFKDRVSSTGEWDVIEAEEGYLIKRQKNRNSIRSSAAQGRRTNSYYHLMETNIHGGTTATLAIVLNSRRLVIANVGDSTALFGGVDTQGRVLYKELSAEHSPESIEEFSRVKEHYESSQAMINASLPEGEDVNGPAHARNMRGRDGPPMTLRFVYDVIDRSTVVTPKHSCPPIFEVDSITGTVKRANTSGHYYKNVRSEWATLVTTPPTARFQDALAFTRSLGDLHLHVYGVSHIPEVREYDLSVLHEQVTQDRDDPNGCSLLLVCTDGVWDNWKYDDIIRRVLSSSLIPSTVHSANAQQLTDEMMMENIRLARNYFGHQADNMTGILCLIHSDNRE